MATKYLLPSNEWRSGSPEKAGRPRPVSTAQRGLAKRSVVGIFWTGLSMGALAVAELVALLVLARLLSPNTFGLYAAALVIIKFSAIFEGLGVAPAIVQRPVLEERHLRVGFTLSILLSFTIAGLVWVTSPAIAGMLRLPDLVPVVRVACVVLLCQGASMVSQASAQRALRFRWLASVDAAAFAIGFAVIGPALAFLGYGIWALIGALVRPASSARFDLAVGTAASEETDAGIPRDRRAPLLRRWIYPRQDLQLSREPGRQTCGRPLAGRGIAWHLCSRL